MKTGLDRKAELINELAWSRAELTRSVRATRSDLNLVAHLKSSFIHQKTAWITGAAITGWILSRLPSRKKSEPKADSLPANQTGWVKDAERTGFLLAALNVLFNICKPVLTAFATRKISEYASSRSGNWTEQKPFR